MKICLQNARRNHGGRGKQIENEWTIRYLLPPLEDKQCWQKRGKNITASCVVKGGTMNSFVLDCFLVRLLLGIVQSRLHYSKFRSSEGLHRIFELYFLHFFIFYLISAIPSFSKIWVIDCLLEYNKCIFSIFYKCHFWFQNTYAKPKITI